jgi:potassium efflux system protein
MMAEHEHDHRAARRGLWSFVSWVCLILFALPLVSLAQIDEAQRLTLGEVRESRDQVAANAALDEDLQGRALALYNEAIGFLEAAAADETLAIDLERQAGEAASLITTLEAELNRPTSRPRMDIPERASTEYVEGELARERARLAANREALRNAERLAQERATRRRETAGSLGKLDQEIESISDQLRSSSHRQERPELTEANRIRLLAHRDAAKSKRKRLRSTLALLDARGPLIPGTIDQAQRRVAYSQQLVDLIEAAARAKRREDDEASLQRTREQCDAAAEQSVALQPVAIETRELAEMLWGTESVAIRSDRTVKTLLATRKHNSDLDRINQLTRRQFEAVGYRGNITRWWPEIPDDFPRPGDTARVVNELERRIPEVQHDLIQLEQYRASAHELADEVMDEVLAEAGEGTRPEVERATHQLLLTRRKLLDELIQAYGRYSGQLTELDTVSRNFLSNSERLQAFLYERLLWSRSVPRPIISRPGDVLDAAAWMISWQNWKAVIGATRERVAQVPVKALAALLGIGLLVGLRSRIRRRLAVLAGRVATPETDSFGATLRAAMCTVLLAAPLPLVLYLCSWELLAADASTFVFSAGQALGYVAGIALLLETTRQLAAPHGLAEGHLGWPSRITQALHRGLFWPEVVFLPMMYVSLHLVAAGQRLNSPEELQAHNNSLGRLCFIAAMVLFGTALLGLARPRRELQDRPLRWSRLSAFAFPVVILTTFVPAGLAILGYYITGLLLAYQLQRTLWLGVVLLLIGGLLSRWPATRRSRPSPDESEEAQAPVAKAQVNRLIRTTVILSALIGLYTIWSPALPQLQLMKRVQLWPSIALLEAPDVGEPSPTAALRETTSAEAPGGGAATPVAPVVPGLVPDTAAGKPGEPLTLWHLLEAILAAAITLAVVQNLPGLVELTLQRKARLDSGARIALGTLVRYGTMIIGVSVTFGLLGVSWSKIQWLAAALTFGLGFGLQEIVANFVSGLILLVERPVRVGDAVSVGELQGRVTRIQIRATTIGLWDRSEMIVPNKEFVTTKLINWTLTDSRRRLDIPLRVTYDANLDLVKRTLVDVAKRHRNVVEDPEPHALLLSFGEDALKFELRCFVEFGLGLQTRDELHMEIDRAFREAGIAFAMPQLNLQIPRRIRGAQPAEGSAD